MIDFQTNTDQFEELKAAALMIGLSVFTLLALLVAAAILITAGGCPRKQLLNWRNSTFFCPLYSSFLIGLFSGPDREEIRGGV